MVPFNDAVNDCCERDQFFEHSRMKIGTEGGGVVVVGGRRIGDVGSSVDGMDAAVIPQQLELIHNSTSRRKRRVRFSGSRPSLINPNPEFYHDDDIGIRWLNHDDLSEIRRAAKGLSAAMRRSDLTKDLSLAHRKTTLVLSSDFRALMKLPRGTPDVDLARWCATCDAVRGLERFASRDYACFRRRDIEKTRTAVLNEQTRQRRSNVALDMEAMASSSREMSRRSRTFALFFGEADAAQVQPKDAGAPPLFRRAPPRKRSKIAHNPQCAPAC